VALLALGAFILYDSVSKLLKFEHPPIDLVKPFGDRPIWLGWLMLGALAYSTVPQVILGRLKQPLAKELNDKVLYADAEMNRADWMTGCAAMLGVVGIGFGCGGPTRWRPASSRSTSSATAARTCGLPSTT
jgi:cobalt-zinc-cadmium efflux system protein